MATFNLVLSEVASFSDSNLKTVTKVGSEAVFLDSLVGQKLNAKILSEELTPIAWKSSKLSNAGWQDVFIGE